MKMTQEEKLSRKIARQKERSDAKELAIIEAEKNQRPVKELEISIEWKKSYMWGHNPKAEVRVSYHDGGYDYKEGYTTSGCGYDKESTVIANIFNDFLKYKLFPFQDDIDRKQAPYGIRFSSEPKRWGPNFSGGIGTNCYFAISEYIGGKFERVASGKSFDAYKWTDNKE